MDLVLVCTEQIFDSFIYVSYSCPITGLDQGPAPLGELMFDRYYTKDMQTMQLDSCAQVLSYRQFSV